MLHKFVNRPNSLPPVPLFKVGDVAKITWMQYGTKPCCGLEFGKMCLCPMEQALLLLGFGSSAFVFPPIPPLIFMICLSSITQCLINQPKTTRKTARVRTIGIVVSLLGCQTYLVSLLPTHLMMQYVSLHGPTKICAISCLSLAKPQAVHAL